ncbi:MAG: preprotein translocase subunit SecG [Oligoflexia bacterium]|nr:preprotein translocase subunit SecG [Oligoflexia bacterium]MBF0364547.1 preprotein translocase subunit SecG [Oligoflexia bacterium]
MITVLSIIHIFVCILLILTVLIHFGKGAEAGLVLDTSASSILPQKGNILNKITNTLAVLFLVISLSLAVMRGKTTSHSVFDTNPIAKKPTTTSTTLPITPAAPATAPISSSSGAAAPAATEKK